jgi:hypothetical protein
MGERVKLIGFTDDTIFEEIDTLLHNSKRIRKKGCTCACTCK